MAVQIKDFDLIKTNFIDALKSRIQENGGPDVTDYNIGSVINVFIESAADVMEQLYYDMFQITKSSLENIYNGFNFFKIPGKLATCSVQIYLDTTNLSEAQNVDYLNIPKGTKLSTEDGTIEFEIIDDYNSAKLVLAVGGEFDGKVVYVAAATSTTTGADQNILQNKLTKFTTDITNINGYSVFIRNASASGATDEESDESMKSRFQKYLVSLRRGTKESIEFALNTNAAFTGLLFSINQYTPLFILKQKDTSYALGPYNYDADLTLFNKFDSSYTLLTDADATGTAAFALYFGSNDKFFNLLLATLTIPVLPDFYEIDAIQYYDGISKSWVNVTTSNLTLPNWSIVDDQYVTWTLDSSRWGKLQIKDYNAFFIRLILAKSGNGIANLEVIKSMTYPFPGFVDIYCLKNFRNTINTSDKTVIEESIENFKAAGVVTTVSPATVVQLYPFIVINVPQELASLIPADLIDNIRADVITYANNINIGENFDRNGLYSYLYERYNQYGTIFIYYEYDVSINEDITGGVFKESFRDAIFDSAINEKPDLNFSDVYTLPNLNTLVMTTTGTVLGSATSDYDSVFHNAAY